MQKNLLPLLMAGTLLAGSCAGLPSLGLEGREDTAAAIAAAGGLVRKDIEAAPFILASWQRISDPAQPVNIYIEGDGSAWLSRSTPSGNPTPKDPVALSLAAHDPAPNVIYLARPCQYTPLGTAGNECPDVYWRGKRFAQEVIGSYRTALNQIAGQAHGGIHLIGFSGGANIAGLLAAGRHDVLSLRTVAGNIDNDFFVKFHGVSEMPYSLNMADEAARLKTLPQIHFIGGADETITVDIFNNYFNRADRSSCIRYKVLHNVSHMEGWEDRWPNLISIPVNCGG